jgi:hypothetical protein
MTNFIVRDSVASDRMRRLTLEEFLTFRLPRAHVLRREPIVGYSSWKAQTGSTPFGAARRRLDLPGKGRRSVAYISPEQRAGEPEDRNSAGYRRPGSRCRACVTYTHESDQHVHRQLLEIRVRPTQSESRKRERVTQKVEVGDFWLIGSRTESDSAVGQKPLKASEIVRLGFLARALEVATWASDPSHTSTLTENHSRRTIAGNCVGLQFSRRGGMGGGEATVVYASNPGRPRTLPRAQAVESEPH